jgi:hypothetical protein
MKELRILRYRVCGKMLLFLCLPDGSLLPESLWKELRDLDVSMESGWESTADFVLELS